MTRSTRFQSQMRSRSTCDKQVFQRAITVMRVSISDEKPLHMRRSQDGHSIWQISWFQSQMRSRSTCDITQAQQEERINIVSITHEKPLHMRRRRLVELLALVESFHL